MVSHLSVFIKQTIWQMTESELTTGKAFAIKSLKIMLLSLHGFQKNACELRSNALTMYTILSIVPMFAMLFGVAKGFGFEKTLKQELLAQITAQDTLMIRLIDFAENMLANAKGGVVAGMGIILLFWTVIKVIGTIEESFNQIWQIKEGRTLARKLSDYLSLMLLAPVLLIVSSSISVFISTKITWLAEKFDPDDNSSAILLNTLNYLPILIMTLLFSFIFIFMPNQKVEWHAGVIAGLITGIIYQLVQWVYLTLQIGVSGYNAIYGSFAAIPLFFIWLQLGWVIVLFGCQIAFYIQYYHTYKHHEHYSQLSFSGKKIVALQIAHLIIQRFAKAEKALSIEQIASQLNLPQSLVKSILLILLEATILVEIKDENPEITLFQPARDIQLIHAYLIINALENQGDNFLTHRKELAPFIKISEHLDRHVKPIAQAYLLKALSETIK